MNEIEALRYAAEFLESKKFHVYSSNGVGWMALDTRSGSIRALRAEAKKRERDERS